VTNWKQPPIIKVYEALGAIGDERVEVRGNEAVVWSSGRSKHYDVCYDPESGSIMANDNGSYWLGYLGYPAMAFLMVSGVIKYNPKLAIYLSEFDWKSIAGMYKNDWDQVASHVRQEMQKRYPEINMKLFEEEINQLHQTLSGLGLQKLGSRTRPPR
jgi:hypothetical protein